MVMFNPQIVKQSGGYEAEEGLSLIHIFVWLRSASPVRGQT